MNTEVIAKTSLELRRLYEGCSSTDIPIVIYMGNPVTVMTWVGYKTTGFPRENVMGQAGNLDSRRICHAISQELGLSGTDMQGIVFGEHGDSMVASPRYFSVGGVPLDVLARSEGIDPKTIEDVIEPYLIQQGYLMRTPRGRVATRHAFEHLGKNRFQFYLGKAGSVLID